MCGNISDNTVLDQQHGHITLYTHNIRQIKSYKYDTNVLDIIDDNKL